MGGFIVCRITINYPLVWRCTREYFLRFLRFLRNDLSVNTSDWGRWLDQAKDAPAQSKSSNRLPSLCSTQPHINGLFAQVLTPMRRETCVPGTRKVIAKV
jgi:hypothetical protein